MAKQNRLTEEDRRFFSLVAKSIYMNPFVDERKDVLLRISPGWFPGMTVAPELNAHIDRLDADGASRIQDFREEDRRLMMEAYLYQQHIRLAPDFQSLIKDQIAHPGRIVPVPFAADLKSRLRTRGLSEEECDHRIALFYQLHRAYYFISQDLIGDSPAMKKLRHALWNNVFTYDLELYDLHLYNRLEDFSTLLLGETGSGKGSAAAAIGRSGYIPFDAKTQRFTHSFLDTFVSINLSQFPESLIESELFGHKKGAFTGAVEDHEGVFEHCSVHGALFLDEIGDIAIPIQIKLLQVLEERTFTPVGSHQLKRFEGRVIAATNRPVDELRKQGAFRNDFFYRLCSDIITVPTLRQRISESYDELPLMVNLLISRITGTENPGLADMVMSTLDEDLPGDYPWPGNVRELGQAVRRILLTQQYRGDTGTADSDLMATTVKGIENGSFAATELLGNYCRILFERYGTYQEVARRTGLDPRTVKKHIRA